MSIKVCSKCKQEKSTIEFNRKYSRPNGTNYNSSCKDCIKKYNKKPERMEARRQAARRCYRKLRKEILSYYSDDSLECNCCGESTYEFLTLDHINGGGVKHRKSLSSNGADGGHKVYSWLRTQGYPEGYQVLCWNCNCAKGHYGKCPHKEMQCLQKNFETPLTDSLLEYVDI